MQRVHVLHDDMSAFRSMLLWCLSLRLCVLHEEASCAYHLTDTSALPVRAQAVIGPGVTLDTFKRVGTVRDGDDEEGGLSSGECVIIQCVLCEMGNGRCDCFEKIRISKFVLSGKVVPLCGSMAVVHSACSMLQVSRTTHNIQTGLLCLFHPRTCVSSPPSFSLRFLLQTFLICTAFCVPLSPPFLSVSLIVLLHSRTSHNSSHILCRFLPQRTSSATFLLVTWRMTVSGQPITSHHQSHSTINRQSTPLVINFLSVFAVLIVRRRCLVYPHASIRSVSASYHTLRTDYVVLLYVVAEAGASGDELGEGGVGFIYRVKCKAKQSTRKDSGKREQRAYAACDLSVRESVGAAQSTFKAWAWLKRDV